METCWGKRGKQLKVPFPNTQDGLGQDATWGVHAEGELSGVFFFFFLLYICVIKYQTDLVRSWQDKDYFSV